MADFYRISEEIVLSNFANTKSFFHDGLEFNVAGQVFSPQKYPGSQKFTEWLGAANELAGKTMTEVGSGSGFSGQYLLIKHGMVSLNQGDINPFAVECARENSRNLGIADRVTVSHSDVFDGMPKVKADIIYWNHPWSYLSEGAVFNEPIKHSFYDPGYHGLQKYIQGAAEHINPEGRVFLGFSSRGNQRKLRQLAGANGYEALLVEQADMSRAEARIMLYEFVRPTGKVTVEFGGYSI